MPYAEDFYGIYRITNTATNECYVGQSQRVKKRIREHFRLLKKNKHPNAHLQNSFNKYGSGAFLPSIEVICESFEELDLLEEAFINGDAWFGSPVVFNIASFAKAPMRGRKHTEATKDKIRRAKLASGFDYSNQEYRESLRAGQLQRVLSDSNASKKIAFILQNDHLSYAERGRMIGMDTSSVRRKYLKYKDKKELFNG